VIRKVYEPSIRARLANAAQFCEHTLCNKPFSSTLFIIPSHPGLLEFPTSLSQEGKRRGGSARVFVKKKSSQSHVERRCSYLGPTQSRASTSILQYTKRRKMGAQARLGISQGAETRQVFEISSRRVFMINSRQVHLFNQFVPDAVLQRLIRSRCVVIFIEPEYLS
jgi:hypothetical protein